jgi:hypothetical protein
MRHDLRLRAAARAIFETVYPTDDWTPVCFDEAERHGTVHYRQAVDAARRAQLTFAADVAAQLELGPL